MSDGLLLAIGCGVFFLCCAGVYVYLRAGILPAVPRVVREPGDALLGDAAERAA